MLLYVGAGTDIRPVTRYAHAHKDFIYVDAHPDKPISWGTEAKHIKDAMTLELRKEQAFESLKDIDADTFEIRLFGGGRILYFMNVLDDELHAHPTASQYFRQADTLYMNAFCPCFQEPPPNVRTVMGNYLCFRGVLRQDWFRSISDRVDVQVPLYKGPCREIDHIEIECDEPDVKDITYYFLCEHCREMTSAKVN